MIKEVLLTCEVCGKQVKAFVRDDKKTFLCQQCAKKLNIT